MGQGLEVLSDLPNVIHLVSGRPEPKGSNADRNLSVSGVIKTGNCEFWVSLILGISDSEQHQENVFDDNQELNNIFFRVENERKIYFQD